MNQHYIISTDLTNVVLLWRASFDASLHDNDIEPLTADSDWCLSGTTNSDLTAELTASFWVNVTLCIGDGGVSLFWTLLVIYKLRKLHVAYVQDLTSMKIEIKSAK